MQTKHELNHSLFIFGLMILFFIAAFPLVHAQTAAPGDLDTTFGNGGKVTTFFGQFNGGEDVAVQADGKIVVAGVASLLAPGPQIAVARYNADGSLDASFGTGGRITTSVAHQTNATSLAIQTDGRIVVGAVACAALGGCDFTVIRYTVTGALDNSFDGDGKAVIDFGSHEWAYDAAVQPDGKIVLAGITSSSAGGRLALARLNSNGSLDSSFDNDGRLVLGVDSSASALTVQTDGKIIAAGKIGNSALVRFHTDGSLDSSFDGDGIAITSGPGGYAEVTLQSDGKIVAVSQANNSFAVARHNSNGSLDTTFGGNGTVITSFGEVATPYSVAIQSNGKIIAGGSSGNNFALVRYNPDGSPDASFGTGGKVTTNFGSYYYGAASGLAIQPDGKIVAAGFWGFDFKESYFAIARYIGDSPVTNRKLFDFDGDGKSDFSVFRPSEGNWYVRSNAGISVRTWGVASDQLVPGDYDGDGKTDLGIFRPTPGDSTDFYIIQSNGFVFSFYSWGDPGDKPVTGDYDGDGKDDIAVFRPTENNWYIRKSTGGIDVRNYGQAGDVPVPGRYDGDSRTDLALYRNGQWLIKLSGGGTSSANWGIPGDMPVQADYDGDNKDDVAVWRPSEGIWYIRRSSSPQFDFISWGQPGDIPVPGDYDGDGMDDPAIYRNGTWYLNQSNFGLGSTEWGVASDIPIPSKYIP